MQYEVNFGRLGSLPRASASAVAGQKFRLALLGDFSGRANAGKLETGAALGKRKPIRVDVDNLDDVMARLALSLSLALAEDGSAVTVAIAGVDDFHPDRLAESVGLFGQLRTLRRDLGSRTGFERAAKEVLSWGGGAPVPPQPAKARGADVPSDRRLSDFARLTGRTVTPAPAAAAADDLMRRLVGPFIVPAQDARQDQLVARVDAALSASMRRVLHHPDFQAAEAIWRGVDFLVRRIETGARSEIVLYDVSAEELAADVAATDALEATGLYDLLAVQPGLDAHQGPISAVIGLYGFDLVPPHADLLGRVAQIAAAARAPFIGGIAPDPLKLPMHEQHPLIQHAWIALRELPEAAYLGLAAPRFLLRLPYGRKTDPIEAFAFEEFTRQEGLGGMLWGHPALLPALLLAESWAQQGAKLKLGSVLSADEMPYYVYIETDGEQVALPCTERLYTERQAAQVVGYGVMPLLSLRGRPQVRLGGLTSLAGKPLAGFWAPVDIPKAARPPPPPSAPQARPAAPPAAAQAPAADDLDAPPAAVAAPPAAADEGDDLDKLLASLNAPPAAAGADATEPDLDALLASLK